MPIWPAGWMSAAEPTRRAVVGGGVVAAAALAASRALAASSFTVRTRAGEFHGEADRGVQIFRGIRYGRADRFSAPGAVSSSGQPVLATSFGPVSPQGSREYQPQSEDCLYLNIWTAEAKARAEARDGLYSRRRLFERQFHRPAKRRTSPRSARRCGGGHRQSPVERPWLSLPRTSGPAIPQWRQRRAAGPRPRAQMDPRQHCSVRWRSEPRHRVRTVRRWGQDRDPDGDARLAACSTARSP